jgi:hypothetical protein
VFDGAVSYRAAYTDKEPSHEPEILAALIWLAKQRSTTREAILVFGPYRATFENSALLTKHRYRGLRFMGQQAMERGYKWEGGLALAMWPTVEMLSVLDGHSGIRALAAVMWDRKSVEPWARARGAVDLLQPVER